MTTRKPLFTDDEAQDLASETKKMYDGKTSDSPLLKSQALATLLLADRVSEANNTFNRIADALEVLVAKGANDHDETMDVLNALKENTSAVVKKSPHFSQKN